MSWILYKKKKGRSTQRNSSNEKIVWTDWIDNEDDGQSQGTSTSYKLFRAQGRTVALSKFPALF